MIAIDTEYIPENAIEGKIPSPRPDVRTTYCEIMQIGACKLGVEGNEIETLDIIVKPSFIFRIPEWLKEMTDMSEEKRSHGVSFQQAVQRLNEFIGKEDQVWTFSGDWWVFINSARKHNLPLPFKEFQLVKPLLSQYAITETRFREKGFKEVCSGDLHKVLGIEIPNLRSSTHDALYMMPEVWHIQFSIFSTKLISFAPHHGGR